VAMAPLASKYKFKASASSKAEPKAASKKKPAKKEADDQGWR